MKILVGSKNPVKIAAVNEAFGKYFNPVFVEGMDVISGVPSQPVNSETFEGAKNRVMRLREINEVEKYGAEFFVGIEGGIIELYDKWFAFGGMCIADPEGRTGFGTSPFFELPDVIVAQLLRGRELGDVMDDLMNSVNTKQRGGAIGFFTSGILERKDLYVPGLITALIPLLNKEIFFGI